MPVSWLCPGASPQRQAVESFCLSPSGHVLCVGNISYGSSGGGGGGDRQEESLIPSGPGWEACGGGYWWLGMDRAGSAGMDVDGLVAHPEPSLEKQRCPYWVPLLFQTPWEGLLEIYLPPRRQTVDPCWNTMKKIVETWINDVYISERNPWKTQYFENTLQTWPEVTPHPPPQKKKK